MVQWAERENMAKRKGAYDSQLNLRINRGLRERFSAYSEKTGISQSDYLRSFIQDLVNGKFESKSRFIDVNGLAGMRERQG